MLGRPELTNDMSVSVSEKSANDFPFKPLPRANGDLFPQKANGVSPLEFCFHYIIHSMIYHTKTYLTTSSNGVCGLNDGRSAAYAHQNIVSRLVYLSKKTYQQKLLYNLEKQTS